MLAAKIGDARNFVNGSVGSGDEGLAGFLAACLFAAVCFGGLHRCRSVTPHQIAGLAKLARFFNSGEACAGRPLPLHEDIVEDVALVLLQTLSPKPIKK
ncbi:MAG: hypothetical protein QM775_34415 [Pirellulales bacterium]